MTQCKYFGVCGGCQNQHLSYAQQLENKKHRLQYLLQLYYKKDIATHAKNEYNYRNRMDFIISNRAVGFRQVDERKLIDIESCPISEPRVNQLLLEVREFVKNSNIEPFDKQKKSGVLKYAVIRVADDTAVSFAINEDSPNLAQATDTIRLFAQKTTADNVLIAQVPLASDESNSLECFAVKGEEFLVATFLGKKLYFHTQGFFQNNTLMAEELVSHVKNLIEKYGGKEKTVVDAYGGVGTFGVILADVTKQVISIESHPLASEACSRNIIANDVANMSAINADTESIRKIDIPLDSIFVLDPPRAGLSDKVLRYLLEKKPPVIIYVSCNPTQLAKELVQLSQYYEVQQVDLFDLFPQTNHMEAVITLVRNHQQS